MVNFEQMQCKGILSDEVINVCIFKAGAAIGAVDKGKEVDYEIIKVGTIGALYWVGSWSYGHAYQVWCSMPGAK